MDLNSTEGKQNTPDLDRIMQDGRPVFTGAAEPAADAPGPAVGHPEGAPPGEAGAAEAGAAKAPDAEAPDAPSPAVAPQEPAGKGKESPRGDYRFKTLEDADKAYRLLQGEKTRVELRLKTLETEREGAKAAAEKKAAAEAADKGFLEFATERNKQALAEINDLNPDDPDYTDKAANCWARANLDIRRWDPSSAPAREPRAAGDLDLEAAGGEPPAPGEAPAADAVLSTRTFVEDVLEGANLGIPKDDPLFWAFAQQSPSVNEDGTPIPMKDQIWWAVERTLSYRRDAANRESPSAPKETPAPPGAGSPPASPAAPGAPTPMGRSGAFRPAGGGPAVTGPVSQAETHASLKE